MPRTGEGGARRIAGCQCSLGGMFVQWCHGKEAGAPGPGEHRLDVEGDMMTMRSYHQTRMRVPAILAVLAMILVFAGCGGRVVSVACDAGVQYGNLSDAVAASDVVTVATIDRMKQADGDQQDLYDMTLKSGRVIKGSVESSDITVTRQSWMRRSGRQGRFHREIWCGDQDHCPARQKGRWNLSAL